MTNRRRFILGWLALAGTASLARKAQSQTYTDQDPSDCNGIQATIPGQQQVYQGDLIKHYPNGNCLDLGQPQDSAAPAPFVPAPDWQNQGGPYGGNYPPPPPPYYGQQGGYPDNDDRGNYGQRGETVVTPYGAQRPNGEICKQFMSCHDKIN